MFKISSNTPIGVSQHIVIPEAHDEVAHRFKNLRSLSVALPIFIVLPTIDFHDELRIWAHEVDDKSINRHLPLELPSVKSAIAQPKP